MHQSLLQGVLGILSFIALCALLSENRRKISFKHILLGLGLQIALAVFILYVPAAQKVFSHISQGVLALKAATQEGTQFVFGYLGGGAPPFESQGNTFIFAFQVLPMIIVVSALTMLLFYWNVLPLLVRGLSWAMRKSLDIGGALAVCSAAKIFLGQTEAPLFIRPYLKNMSRSEIFTTMCMGFATTSATIMGMYALVLDQTVPYSMIHILTASLISIPGAIILSRVVIPITTHTEGSLVVPYSFSGPMDAIAKGTSEGFRLFANIIAMLIVFVALVALLNKALGLLPYFSGEPITLQRLLGVLLSPLAWLMGISWQDAKAAGSLLGIKTVLNEFYAFTELARMGDGLSLHTRTIMTYALCGFANISSIGIMIGGLGGLVPEKRPEIITLSLKALIVGTLSSCLSGTLVGMLMWSFAP